MNIHLVITSVESRMTKYKNKDMWFQWVVVHCRTYGNEIADIVAKESSGLGLTCCRKVPHYLNASVNRTLCLTNNGELKESNDSVIQKNVSCLAVSCWKS